MTTIDETESEVLHDVLRCAAEAWPTGRGIDHMAEVRVGEPMPPRLAAFERLYAASALSGKRMQPWSTHPMFFNMKITEHGRDLLAACDASAEQRDSEPKGVWFRWIGSMMVRLTVAAKAALGG